MQAEAWVERYSPARGTTYTVHKAIAEVVNEQRGYQFWGAVATLAKRLRMSRKTVGEAVDRLVELGLLEVVRAPSVGGQGTGRTGIYRFVFVPGLPVVFDGQGGELAESPGGESIYSPRGDGAQGTTVSAGQDAAVAAPTPDSEGGESIYSPGASIDSGVSRSAQGCVDLPMGESIDARTGVELQGTTATTPNACAGDVDFEAWWSGYPRKVDKAKARERYRARRRQGVTAEQLVTARDAYAMSVAGVESRFVKHASVFLHGADGPWSEWVTGAPEGAAGGPVDPLGATRALIEAGAL